MSVIIVVLTWGHYSKEVSLAQFTPSAELASDRAKVETMRLVEAWYAACSF